MGNSRETKTSRIYVDIENSTEQPFIDKRKFRHGVPRTILALLSSFVFFLEVVKLAAVKTERKKLCNELVVHFALLIYSGGVIIQ